MPIKGLPVGCRPLHVGFEPGELHPGAMFYLSVQIAPAPALTS